MSKKLPLISNLRVAFVVLTIGLFGCNNAGNIANTAYTSINTGEVNNRLPKVVATTSVICDLTRQVAAETINLICLTSGDTNPRLYQPTPDDQKAIEQAKLILFNGYSLEPGILKLLKVSKSHIPKIAVAQRSVSKPIQLRGNGDRVPDPYVWHNAKNAIKMVEVISTYLGKVLPKNASIYNSNARKLKNELTQLDTWIKSRIASIPPNQHKLVTADDAMGYYVQAYGLSYVGAVEGINTGSKSSTARLKTLIQNMKQARVQTIFADTTSNLNLIKTVAKEANVKVAKRELFANSLGALGSEGDTYQKMMIANTRTIVEGLGGTYLIFDTKVADK